MEILDRPSRRPAAPAADRFTIETIVSDEPGETFADAVATGLDARPRSLPCRFFYDERGSLLFEEITQLEEYYPTRVERSILRERAAEIARAVDASPELVELGSGSASKTRLLIRALIAEHGHLLFRPIDISPTILETSSLELLEEHPRLEIAAMAAEYDDGLERLARLPRRGPRLIAWLGSSIGNLHRSAAAAFLARVRSLLHRDDRVLIGIDRRKDADTLERAYDDEKGVTAEFNRNLLERANRELGADFDPGQFEHRALWRDDVGRVEMHLVSRRRQRVHVADLGTTFEFERGESIHTESSYKYSREEIDHLADRAGLHVEQRWSDGRERFELSLLAAAAPGRGGSAAGPGGIAPGSRS